MSRPTLADGARALSIQPDEVAKVEDAPGGLVVTTADGARYIVVPPDRTDADGKTGVMFLVPPTDPYHGIFPVYSQPVDDDVAPAPATVAGTRRARRS